MYLSTVHKFLFRCHKTIRTLTAISKRSKSSNDQNCMKSKSADIFIPSDELLTDYVWKNVDKWISKTAVICFETGRSYTYGQIRSKSKNLAASLQKMLNMKKGSTVSLILPNVPEFPIALFGSLEAGLVVTTVNPYYTADEMALQILDSETQLIFTTDKLFYLVKFAKKHAKRHIPIVLIHMEKQVEKLRDVIHFDELCDRNDFICENVVNPADVALLPYSSGTTGVSKGVLLTHTNVVSNLYQMSSDDFSIYQRTEDTFQDKVPILLPLFHIYGLVAIFLNFFSKGCQLITVPNFTAPQFTKMLKIYRPTLLFTVPQIILFILNSNKLKYEDLASIRTIVSAAAPLGGSAFEKFHEKTNGNIDLLQMYGMTETSPLTLVQTKRIKGGIKVGGSGFLLPNTECKIASLDEEFEENNKSFTGTLASYQTGELLMRGPQIMKGYHNNPKATQEVLVGDGWLRTGDIGYYDDDQHFFITDRLKELIKVKGFQVAPAELEEILKSHSSIADVAVVGVPHRVQGEAPRAFVVLKKNAPGTKSSELKEFVASKVAPYKRLVGGVVFTKKIPRTPAGKVLRRELRNFVEKQ